MARRVRGAITEFSSFIYRLVRRMTRADIATTLKKPTSRAIHPPLDCPPRWDCVLPSPVSTDPSWVPAAPEGLEHSGIPGLPVEWSGVPVREADVVRHPRRDGYRPRERWEVFPAVVGDRESRVWTECFGWS